MKAKSLYMIILLTFAVCTNVFAEDGFHTVKSPISSYSISFRNTPENMPHIRSFTAESIQNYPEILNVQNNVEIFPRNYGMKVTIQLEDSVETITVFYWIHTSASEAEEGYVDRMSISNIRPQNSSDYKDIEKIGDNSFHYMKRMIYFIRNNVRVHVNNNPSYLKYEAVLRVAELIDEALVQADKIDDVSLLPAPVITSVKLLDDTLPQFLRIKLDAYDPNGKKLSYDYSGRALGDDSFEDGILKVLKYEKNVNYFNIWVMNEDRIVSKIQYFLTPSAVTEEGTTTEKPQAFTHHRNVPNPFNPGNSYRVRTDTTGIGEPAHSAGRLPCRSTG